jgi:crotonobetainyl-CoA:carnitine CoA-transferase CaiB-like acyl-CoA transferase
MVPENTILNNRRVLDLTDDTGFLCGKILADLGADVIKIEKPGGDESRYRGPFYHDIKDPDKNLYWFTYNQNKRGITLNIEDKKGREILIKMVRDSDFIIESFTPGYLEKLDLNYASINQINPRIIMTSITPFGQTGPYKNYQASDIEIMAMSGLLYITGNPGEPPLRISLPQSFLLASAHAATASMIAHYYRETSGQGQHVDVSAQECVLWEIANAIPLWEMNKNVLKRAGSYMSGRWKGSKQRLLWRCKNGYVLFYILGGAFGVKTNRAVVKWMEEKNIAPDYLKDFNWDAFDMATQTQEEQDQIEVFIGKLFALFTKEELYEQALKRGIMLCPVNTSKDILGNGQLKDRNFWVDIVHPELDTSIKYPGVFAKLSETPLSIKRRAPLTGEHNIDVYKHEYGFSVTELNELKKSGVI